MRGRRTNEFVASRTEVVGVPLHSYSESGGSEYLIMDAEMVKVVVRDSVSTDRVVFNLNTRGGAVLGPPVPRYRGYPRAGGRV